MQSAKNNEKVIIIGGEGTATNIAECIIDAKLNHNYPLDFIGFANDKYPEVQTINNHPILCKIKDVDKILVKNKNIKIIFALYKPSKMKERAFLLKSLKIPEEYFINFIHPRVYISPSTKLGIGNIFLPGCNVLSNTKIQSFNIFNCNCTIEHDTLIESNNFFAAGSTIGASVKICNFNFVGLNSSIRENLIIPNGTFLGMNSNLLKSPENKNELWYGNPAKRSHNNNQ